MDSAGIAPEERGLLHGLSKDLSILTVSMQLQTGIILKRLYSCPARVLREFFGGQMRTYEARPVVFGKDKVVTIVRDITDSKKEESFRDGQRLTDIAIERQQAADAIRKSEEHLRMAHQAARVGTWEWDVLTGESVWSEMIWHLLGLEPDEDKTTVERFIESIHPEDRERVWRKVNEVIAEGEEYYDEFRLVRRGGEILWLSSKGRLIRSASGRPERMLGVNIDITERKLAEAALKESEHQVRLFVEHTPVAVAMFDREMRYLMTSRRWLKDNDLGEQDIIGRSHYEVVPDIPERWKEGHRRCLTGAVERCEEDVFQRPDGSTDWVRWEIRPWYDASGAVGGLIMFSEMITERKRTEDELLRLTARLFNIQDEERRRIARELHDSTAQNLFAMTFNLTRLQEHECGRDAEVQRVLTDTLALCNESLKGIRTLSYLLHPPLLDEAGLVSALRWYVEGFTRRSGIYVDLIVLQEIGRLPSEIETALFRIVQESLTNVHRHSGSASASIRLEKKEGNIVLQIKDQGGGLPLQEALKSSEEIIALGVGIAGMRQRMRQLGGLLEVESGEKGTVITASAPLTKRDNSAVKSFSQEKSP